ncbi:MAG: helix-turn-helix domain-containing protein [Candidatus Poribacteria bacterium]|nr:helix-turn-helix domain-containing protein [Candidatus Poribacteria bacterium]
MSVTIRGRTYPTFDEILVKRFREDPEEEQVFLNVVLEEYQADNDLQTLLACLRIVVEAHGGVSELARKIEMPRQTLYKALSAQGNPRLSTIGKILNGLGYSLFLKSMKKQDDETTTSTNEVAAASERP